MSTGEWWTNTVAVGQPLTLEKLQGMIEKLSGPEAQAAERRRILECNNVYVSLRRAAEKAGVLDHHMIKIALAHAAHGTPVSPSTYAKVKELLGYE